MNKFWEQNGSVFVLTQALREQLMEVLTDADLAYTPGGDNPTLGEICCEMGGIEYSYIQSIKTLAQEWANPETEPGMEMSVEKLKAWFKELDSELNTLLQGMTDEEIEKPIVRKGGWTIPTSLQVHIYREALLIFYGRASVYLRALRKSMPEQWVDWIGG